MKEICICFNRYVSVSTWSVQNAKVCQTIFGSKRWWHAFAITLHGYLVRQKSLTPFGLDITASAPLISRRYELTDKWRKIRLISRSYHLWTLITQIWPNFFLTRFHRNVDNMLMNDKLKQFLCLPIFKWHRKYNQVRFFVPPFDF